MKLEMKLENHWPELQEAIAKMRADGDTTVYALTHDDVRVLLLQKALEWKTVCLWEVPTRDNPNTETVCNKDHLEALAVKCMIHGNANLAGRLREIAKNLKGGN